LFLEIIWVDNTIEITWPSTRGLSYLNASVTRISKNWKPQHTKFKLESLKFSEFSLNHVQRISLIQIWSEQHFNATRLTVSGRDFSTLTQKEKKNLSKLQFSDNFYLVTVNKKCNGDKKIVKATTMIVISTHGCCL